MKCGCGVELTNYGLMGRFLRCPSCGKVESFNTIAKNLFPIQPMTGLSDAEMSYWYRPEENGPVDINELFSKKKIMAGYKYNARKMFAEVMAAKRMDQKAQTEFLLDYVQFLMDNMPGQDSQFESCIDDIMAEGEIEVLPRTGI